MAIIRYKPSDIFSNLQEEMNKLFDSRLTGIDYDQSTSVLNAWKPKVDIKEDSDKYTVIADLPGVDIKDLQVSMEHNNLTIQGKRKSDSDTKTEDYHRIERFSGSFESFRESCMI
ncbi:MAG: Hsp20/alpha crystallin family protein [Methanobacteriaceae archaeon]